MGRAYMAIGALGEVNRDWAAGEEAFDRARDVSPNDVTVLSRYAAFKRNTGDQAAALEAGRRAVALDPNNSAAIHQLAITHMFGQDYDSTVAAFQEVLKINPNQIVTRVDLAGAELARGNDDEAIRQLRINENLMETVAPFVIRKVHVRVRAWRVSRMKHSAFSIGWKTCVKTLYVGSADRAMAHMGIGDYDEAIRLLEGAIENPEPVDFQALSEIEVNIWNDPVLDEDPRFVAARERIGATGGGN